MRRSPLVWGVLAWLVFFIPSAYAQQANHAGAVTALKPQDYLVRGKKTSEARKGDDVLWKDILRTQPGGRVRLGLDDGSILNIGSEAEVQIVEHDAQTQQSDIVLGFGKMRAVVKQLSGANSKFQVHTNTSVLGVIGTDFFLDARPGFTYALSLQGIVTVRSSNLNVPGVVTLYPGEATTINAGQPPEPKHPATEEEIAQALDATQVTPSVTVNPTSAVQGSVFDATITGKNLLPVGALNVSGTGVTVEVLEGATETEIPVRITVAADAPLGSHPFTLQAPQGELSGEVAVTPLPGFELHLSPGLTAASPLAVSPGGTSAPEEVLVSSLAGFTGSVTLSLSGVPAGVTPTFSATSVEAGGSAQLTFAASANAAPGDYSLTLTGTSAALTATAQVFLHVGAAAAPAIQVQVQHVFDPSEPPAEVSGSDIQVSQGSLVRLNASGSSVASGRVASFSWQVTDSPLRGSGPQFEINTWNLTPASHRILLDVTSESGATSHAEFRLTVLPPPNPDEVLKGLRQAYETLQVNQYLSYFDPVRFRAYPGLEESVRNSFNGLSEARVYLRIDNSSRQGDDAVYQATFEVSFRTKDQPDVEQSRTESLTLRLLLERTRTSAAWKIVDYGVTVSSDPNAILGSGTVPPGTTAGAEPVLTLGVSPTSLNFGNVLVGTTSSVQTVTVQNVGSGDITLNSITLGISGSPFGLSSLPSLPATLLPGDSLSFDVDFAPVAPGPVSDAITVTSNAPGSPTVIPVSGNGAQPAITITPTSLDFGNVLVGTTSPPQTITIQNTGTADLVIAGVSLSGSSDFTASPVIAPGTTIAPGGSIQVQTVFAPTITGPQSGTGTIFSNAPTSPTTVTVMGTGVLPNIIISPTSLDFGNVLVGATSPAQTITVQNSNPVSVTVNSITLGTGVPYQLAVPSLPAIVAANGSLNFDVIFAPTAAGTANGTITITSTAANSPATVAVTGVGVVPAPSISLVETAGLAADGTTLFITAGTSVTFHYQVTNTGNVDLNNVQVSGTLLGPVGTIASLPVGTSQSLQLTAIINTTVTDNATATATPVGGGSPVQATDNATVQAVAPAVTVIKTAGGAADGTVLTVGAGASVTYSYLVTNTGDTSLSNIQVNDDKLGAVGTIASLATGTSQTLTATTTINADVINTATVTATPQVSGTSQGLVNVGATDNAEVVVSAATDFALSAFNPGSVLNAFGTPLVVTEGLSSTLTVQVEALGGFADTVNLTWSGLPAGVTVSPSSTSVALPGLGMANFTFSAAFGVTPGNFQATLTGSAFAGGLTHSLPVFLQVNASTAGFSLSITPSEGTSSPGVGVVPDSTVQTGALQKTTVKVQVSPTGSFAGDVTLTLTGMPAGVTVQPSTTTISVPSVQQATFLIAAAQGATLGSAQLTVTATSVNPNLTDTAPVFINVVNSFFTVHTLEGVFSPIGMVAGSATTLDVRVEPDFGFTGTVNLSFADLPAGVTVSPSTASVTLSGASQDLAFTISSAVGTNTNGQVQVNILGQGGGLTTRGSFRLSVGPTPDFKVEVFPGFPGESSSHPFFVEAGSGNQVFFDFQVVPISGFQGNVTVSIAPPAGLLSLSPSATVAVNSTSALFETSEIVAEVLPEAPGGILAVPVTATDGVLTRTTTFYLNIETVELSVVPSTITQPGSPLVLSASVPTTFDLVVRPVGGFSGAVNLSLALQNQTGIAGSIISPSAFSLSPTNTFVFVSGSAVHVPVTYTPVAPPVQEVTFTTTITPSLGNPLTVYTLAEGTGCTATDISLSLFDFGTEPSSFIGANGFVSVNGVVTSPTCTITSIRWDWGDGLVEDHFFPNTHTYSQNGPFTVRVTATSFTGQSQTASLSNSISGLPTTGSFEFFRFEDFYQPPGLTVDAGNSVSTQLKLVPLNGLAAPLSLSVIPSAGFSAAGLTASLSTSSVTLDGTNPAPFTLTIDAAPTASAATPVTVDVQATGTAGTKAVTVFSSVNAAPDFTVDPPAVSTTIGVAPYTGFFTTAAGFIFLTVTPTNSALQSVTCSLDATLPPGIHGQFDPAEITFPNPQPFCFLILQADTSAALGTFNFLIDVTGGGKTHTVSVTATVVNQLYVLDSPGTSFTTGGGLSLTAGTSQTFTVELVPINGFNDQVRVSVGGLTSPGCCLPPGVTVTPTDTTVNVGPTAPTSVTYTISVAPGTEFTTDRTFNIRSQSVLLGLRRTLPIRVTLGQPDVGVEVHNPFVSTSGLVEPDVLNSYSTPLTLDASTNALVSGFVRVQGRNGFSGQVTISFSDLGSSVVASPAQGTATLPGTFDVPFSLQALSSAPRGIYQGTVKVTGGGVTHTVPIYLNIVDGSPASFQLSQSSSSSQPLLVPITPQGFGNLNFFDENVVTGPAPAEKLRVSVNQLNNFSGPVTLSFSGLPAGVSVNPPTITFNFPQPGLTAAPVSDLKTPKFQQAEFTISADSTATAGDYTATLTATNGVQTQQVQVFLQVRGIFVLSSTFNTFNNPFLVPANGSATLPIQVVPFNGFTGTVEVTLNTDDLPPGITVQNSTVSVNITGASAVTANFVFSTTNADAATRIGLTFLGKTQMAPGYFFLFDDLSPVKLIVGSTQPSFVLLNAGFAASTSNCSASTFVFSSAGRNPPPDILFIGGASGCLAVEVLPLNGFTGTVNLSVTPPSGVSATLPVPSVNLAAGASFVGAPVSIGASSGASPGNAVLTVTGTSGAVSDTLTIPLILSRGITATLSPATSGGSPLSVAAGSATPVTLTLTPQDIPSGSFNFRFCPAVQPDFGLAPTVTPSPQLIALTAPGTASATVNFIAPSSGPAVGHVQFLNCGFPTEIGELEAPTLVYNLGASDGVTVSVTPTSSFDKPIVVPAGGSTNLAVNVVGQNGFAGSVTVAFPFLPTGLTATPSSQVVTAGTDASPGVANFTLSASSTTSFPAQQLPLSISGASPTVLGEPVVLAGTPGFTLCTNVGFPSCSTSPINLSLAVSDSAFLGELFLQPSGGFSGNVTVSVSGVPAGVTISPPSQTLAVTPAETGIFLFQTFTASGSVVPGIYPLTFSARDGVTTSSVTVNLEVFLPSFAMTVSPTPGGGQPLHLSAGSSTVFTVTFQSENSFAGTINYAASLGGFDVTVSPTSGSVNVTAGGQATQDFTVTTTANAFQPSTGLNVLATAGPSQGSVFVPLAVGNADFDVSLSSGCQNFNFCSPIQLVPGGEGQTVVASVEALNGFSGTVHLDVTNLPAGILVNLPQQDLPVAGFNQTNTSTQMLFTAQPTIGQGDYLATLTATDGVTTKNFTIHIQVVTVLDPDVQVLITPATTLDQPFAINPGGPARTATVTLIPTGGFRGILQVNTPFDVGGFGLSATPGNFEVNLTSNQAVSTSVSFAAAANSVTGGPIHLTFEVSGGPVNKEADFFFSVGAPSVGLSQATTVGSPLSVPNISTGAATATLPVTISPLNNFSGTVTLAVSGVPPNLSVSPAMQSLTLTGPTQVTLELGGLNATAGTAQFTLTATTDTNSMASTTVFVQLTGTQLTLSPVTLTLSPNTTPDSPLVLAPGTPTEVKATIAGTSSGPADVELSFDDPEITVHPGRQAQLTLTGSSPAVASFQFEAKQPRSPAAGSGGEGPASGEKRLGGRTLPHVARPLEQTLSPATSTAKTGGAASAPVKSVGVRVCVGSDCAESKLYMRLGSATEASANGKPAATPAPCADAAVKERSTTDRADVEPEPGVRQAGRLGRLAREAGARPRIGAPVRSAPSSGAAVATNCTPSGQVQLAVRAEEIRTEPRVVRAGEPVSFRVPVHNLGTTPATGVVVEFSVPELNLRHRETIDLEAGETATVVFETEFSAAELSRPLRPQVTLDPDRALPEASRRDNVARLAPLAPGSSAATLGGSTAGPRQRGSLTVEAGGCVGFRFSGIQAECGQGADVEFTVSPDGLSVRAQAAGLQALPQTSLQQVQQVPAVSGGTQMPVQVNQLVAARSSSGEVAVFRLLSIHRSPVVRQRTAQGPLEVRTPGARRFPGEPERIPGTGGDTGALPLVRLTLEWMGGR